MAIGGIGLALLDPTTPTWILSALLVPIGLTGPLVMPPTTAVLLNSVPTRRAAIGDTHMFDAETALPASGAMLPICRAAASGRLVREIRR
jgi:hypothetical protein